MRHGEIRSISFSMVTDESVVDRSVYTMRYDEEKPQTDQDKLGTIMDPRLGTVTPGVRCSTCACEPDTCGGHVGDVELRVPIVAPTYLPVCAKIFNCICICCGALLLELGVAKVKRLMRLSAKRRLTELSNRSLRSRGNCRKCGFMQPTKWQVFEHVLLRPRWARDSDNESALPPAVAPGHLYELLRIVSPETARLMGLVDLRSVMLRRFVLPPILMRPRRNSKSEDDLNTRLRAVLAANRAMYKAGTSDLNLSMWDDAGPHGNGELQAALARSEWKPRHQRNKVTLVPQHLEAFFELQRQCGGFMDARLYTKNDLDYGRELASVRQRFVATRHHRGRIRGNILGKRGDYTARAVASPDTFMDPHEVGVPIRVCMHLTIRERVHALNLPRMRELVARGPERYPGANYVERNKRRFILPTFLQSQQLQIGDVVLRHLQAGDMVIMNRQPSLHRYSMMGYRVVPMAGSTFRLHLSVTSAHNLDFDGDEVNLFVPGSVEATAEVRELMAVDRNLFRDGKLLVGFVQHACLGAYLLTQRADLRVRARALQQLWVEARLGEWPESWGGASEIVGREIMRALLPPYDGRSELTKSQLNKLAGVHVAQQRDPAQRIAWIGGVVRFLEAFLTFHGSTLGFVDCVPSERAATQRLVQEGIDVMSTDADEKRIIQVADKLRDVCGARTAAELSLRKRNHLLDITRSGAKGNHTHVVQNACMVGQQFDHRSQRYPKLRSHEGTDAALRGMVTSAFTDGLSPVEFFFHLASSRVGLVGTAVSTAETGYCYRRISKCMEDIRIAFDHSARTAKGSLVLRAGGFDTARVYLVEVRFLSRDIRKEYTGPEHELAHLEQLRRTHAVRRSFFRSVHVPVDFAALKVSTQLCSGERVTQAEVAHIVRAHWAQLRARHVPSALELVYFDYLSSHRLCVELGLQTRAQLDELLGRTERGLTTALLEPGTPIGLIASQSFSEPLTQIQLNRFHHSGEESTMVHGVARVKEIINCVKTIQSPSMTIVLREGADVDPEELLEVSFDDVLSSWTTARAGHVTLRLDRAFMVRRKLTPRMVARALPTVSEHAGFTIELDQPKWYVWFPLSAARDLVRASAGSHEHLQVRSAVQHLRRKNPLVRGVRKIRDYRWDSLQTHVVESDGRIGKRARKCIVTRGSNLRAVYQLPWVDVTWTTTNDIMEVYAVSGIDAACAAIEDNLVQVMTSNAASVSRKYLHLIAHEMCRSGAPRALTFVGLAQSDASRLKLATFERSLDTFLAAAREQHTDDLRGISEAMVVGKSVSVGTGGDFGLVSSVPAVAVPAVPEVYPAVFPAVPAVPAVGLPAAGASGRTTKRRREAESDDANGPPAPKRARAKKNPFLSPEGVFGLPN